MHIHQRGFLKLDLTYIYVAQLARFELLFTTLLEKQILFELNLFCKNTVSTFGILIDFFLNRTKGS